METITPNRILKYTAAVAVVTVGAWTLVLGSCARFERRARLPKTEQLRSRLPETLVPANIPTKPGPTLQQMAEGAAHLCGVDKGRFFRLIDMESHWDVNAVSSSGAIGLAQIKPSTLRHVSPTLDPNKPWDRLVGAACYLRQMYDREQGSDRERWHKALLSYRYGPHRKVTPSTKYADLILEGM